MSKQVTTFTSIIQDIENNFHFESNCPIHIAKESMFQAIKWLGQIEDIAIAKAKEEEKNSEILMEEEQEAS